MSSGFSAVLALHPACKAASLQLQTFDGAMLAGAVRAKVQYSISEPWSVPNVAMLCGLRNAVPIPAPLVPEDGATGSTKAGLGPFAFYRTLPLAATTRDQWGNSLAATSWALDNLYNQCADVATTVVLQACSIWPKVGPA